MMKNRATSLAEVLVAMAVFSLLLVALALLQKSGRDMNARVDVETRVYREVMLACQHLRSELRGADLLEPRAGDPATDHLTYRYPEVIEGRLQVDAEGQTRWAGQAELQLRGGQLVRRESGENRVLANLGEGSVRFERVAGDLLRVDVEAAIESEDHRKRARRALHVELLLTPSP